MRLAAVGIVDAWIVFINQERLYLVFHNGPLQNHLPSTFKWYKNVNSGRKLKY